MQPDAYFGKSKYERRLFAVISIILVPLLIMSCGKGVEMHDFTQEEVDRFAIAFLKKKKILIKKNIGFLALPSMELGIYLSGAGSRMIFPYKDLKECGKTCRDLYNDGFVSDFIAFKQTSPPNIFLQTYGDSEDKAMSYSEFRNRYHSDNSIRKEEGISIGGREYIVIYQVQNDNFVYLSLVKLAKYADPGERVYGNFLVGGLHTLEGFTTWYHIFKVPPRRTGFATPSIRFMPMSAF